MCSSSIWSSPLQDIVDFDVESMVDKCHNYSERIYEHSSLAAYSVIYIELLAGAKNGLSKAVSWKSII